MTMRRKDRLLLAKMLRILRSEKDCIAIPLTEAASLEGIDPKLVADIDERELWAGPSFGGEEIIDTVTIGDLGDYMDEVNSEILQLNEDITSAKNIEAGSQSFRARWDKFIYNSGEPYALPPDVETPRGWRDFYIRERNYFARTFEVTKLWTATKHFEDRFIELWKEASTPAEGFALTGSTPKSGFDKKTTLQSLSSTASTLLTVATIAVGVWGVSQILKLRGGSS